jgi:hypothetical protein
VRAYVKRNNYDATDAGFAPALVADSDAETLQPNSYGARALPRPYTRPRARATTRPLARADAVLDGEHAARDRAAGQSGF